jgi:predicted nuclease of predicted toxin-antitoxin system
MRLLFDQNLSSSLVTRLAHEFPGSAHVRTLGLMEASDAEIWDYARQNGFVLASKDSDFAELSARLGAPPKVILLAMGNCGTAEVEAALRSAVNEIADFINGTDVGCLVIGD